MKTLRYLSFLFGSAFALLLSLHVSLFSAPHSQHTISHTDISPERPSVQLNSTLEGTHLLLNGILLKEFPTGHLGSQRISSDGRYMAVPILPSGTETVGDGQIVIIDMERKSVLLEEPGFDVQWIESEQKASNLLVIDRLLLPNTLQARISGTTANAHNVQRTAWSLVPADDPADVAPILTRISTETITESASMQPTARAASSPSTAELSASPPDYPATIRVVHHKDNQCRNVPVDTVSVIPFEEYVARVVSAEVPASWTLEALKAQAVAVRTYAWYQILIQRPDFDVSDWANFQYMCDIIHERSQQATAETAGIYLTGIDDSIRKPIVAMYSAENSHPTRTNASESYLQAVPDHYGLGKARFGHGYGLSQWGAQRRAIDGHGFAQILGHYYSHVYLRNAVSPTTIIADFVEPLAHGEQSSVGIRWRTVTSPPESFNPTSDQTNISTQLPEQEDLSIHISTSRPLTKTEVVTTLQSITHTVIMTGSGGLSNTITLTDTVLVTETQVVTAALQFTDTAGTWPLPPQLIDGDVITLSLRARGQRLGSSIITLDFNRPNQPTIEQIAGGERTVNEELSSVTVISNIQTSIAGTAEMNVAVGASLDWRWPAVDLFHFENSGEVIIDPNASGGQAWQARVNEHQSGVWYGPYTPILEEGQSYRALFWLKSPLPELGNENVSGLWPDSVIARLDVTDNEGETILGLRDIRLGDFQPQTFNEGYTPIAVDFHIFEPPHGLEFRAAWYGNETLALDQVEIWTYPILAQNGTFGTDLHLGNGFGERSLAVKGFDQAGNVSVPSTQALVTVDLTPPQLQNMLIPNGIISGTPLTITANVIDPFSGLDALASILTISGESVTMTKTVATPSRGHPWQAQTLVFPIEGLKAGNYSAQITTQDRAGNRTESIIELISVRKEATYRQYLPIYD